MPQILSELVATTLPVLDRLGLPRFSWNRLRKLHSTYLGDLGVPPGVRQAQLGHADAALTLNVYAQVLPESQHRAVESLESLFCSEMF